MTSDTHVHENIPAYLAGELSETERRELEFHLRECTECSREFAAQKKLDEVLSKAQPISPRPELIQQVMQQARDTQNVVSFRKRSLLPWLAVAAVVAVILFLLRIQKETPAPPVQVKKSPIVKPEIQKQTPTVKPVPREPEPPQVTKKEKKLPERPVPPKEENEVPTLSPEEDEVVAQLDELENMDVISNYENLENLELALIGESNESLK